MIQPRHTYIGPRRSAPVGGERYTPPPSPPCDTCGGPVSRYNPHRRCHACCRMVGYPVDGAPRRPLLIRGGHTADCECFARRRLLLDADGVPVRKACGGRVYVLTATCPDCDERREVRFGSYRGQLCATGYRLRCRRCQAIAAGHAHRTRVVAA